MSNRIEQLLNIWASQKEQYKWVLATIIETDGSSYRKSGAMMLINDMGQYFGLLSGGCLESDILRQARKCWDNNQSKIIQYDMREEEDLAWQLGIGCGGMVKILLQPISNTNHYLHLPEVLSKLESGEQVTYQLSLKPDQVENAILIENESSKTSAVGSFTCILTPPPSIAVFGGGVDAIPVVSIAKELGWKIAVIDPRVGYAKAKHFSGANVIIRDKIEDLSEHQALNRIDIAFILMHNVKLDAAALKWANQSSCRYIGLLGPGHRTEKVLDLAQLSVNDIRPRFANPVGLRLGGELPESIALCMISEAHAVLMGKNGQSISCVLDS